MWAFRFFTNIPIERKLLLASVIPILALILQSIVIYESVQTFSGDEDRLNHVYLVQTTAAEYLRLIVDLETGFRGYVLTKQPHFLQPYWDAKSQVMTVGETLEQMVDDKQAQKILVEGVQKLVQQLIHDKDALIERVNEGHSEEARHYIEAGEGRSLMSAIRREMARFDRRELQLLGDAFATSARDRSFMVGVVLGGGALALVLMILTLHLIARSITGPLANLAKTVGKTSGGTVPEVPVLDRRDEIGGLTRVMSAMSAQIREHITMVEKSEAELRGLNRDLAASESKYRGIVDHAPFGIFTASGTKLIFSNRYNRTLAGLNPDEDQDPELIWEAIHPDDRERVIQGFTEAIKENVPFECVFRFLHANGHVRIVLSRAVPIEDEGGQTMVYQGFNVDITAREQMQERLSRAERLATLGQVAAGIAHEIRNPLVGIGSTASLLLEDADPADPRYADLETILKETRRLDRIVNQVVDYARTRSVAPVEFQFEDVVHESLRILGGTIRQRHILVEHEVEENLPAIQADRDQLKQVMLNIVQNALEAVREGGRLRIRLSVCDYHQEKGLLAEVEDNGSGISPQEVGHIFEPFFTSGKIRGTGLGLAICRNIIDAHHGEITVRSQLGMGTTMAIRLPLHQQPQPSEV